jgi:hypothetical protein
MHRMRRSMLVKSRSSLMAFFTTVLLVSLGSASAGGKDPLFPGPVRPGSLDYRTELPQGYLKVYTATDEFDDGGVPYYAHSSYTIYTTDGKVFKNVENHISRSDEIPEVVALPAGSYIVEARSERNGYVRVLVVIKAGQRTIVDLDLAKQETYRRYLQTSDRMASSSHS